jgi:hypothetical protein
MAPAVRAFTEAELIDRRPVWAALSELFLDTDTALLERAIAAELAASPYNISEVESILIHEVYPVCVWNVFSWEWAGFAPEWLEERILKKRGAPSRLFYRAWSPISRVAWLRRPLWRRVRRRVAEVKSSLETADETQS